VIGGGGLGFSRGWLSYLTYVSSTRMFGTFAQSSN
jgi:hypothetical protein